MSRISIAACLFIFIFTGLMIIPIFTNTFVGDIIFHAHLLFVTCPAIFAVLFIGTVIEEIFDFEQYEVKR
jgi:hypothetical protein